MPVAFYLFANLSRGPLFMADLHRNLDQVIASFEKSIITETLKETKGNQTRAARILGITKRKIQYKICNYKIDWQSFRDNHLSTVFNNNQSLPPPAHHK
jgi:DNA-binding NtrC family response regulator